MSIKIFNFRNKIYNIQSGFIFYCLKRNMIFRILARLFSKEKYQLLMFENINNYTKSYPNKIKYLYNYNQLLSYSIPKFCSFDQEESNLTDVNIHYIYAAIFQQAIVIGGSNLILLDNDKVIYDLKDRCNKKNTYYLDQGMRYYDETYCLIPLGDASTVIENGIFLGGNFSWNYYHFIYEILVKFKQINELNLSSEIPILVDKIIVEIPQFFQLLSFLNNSDRNIIILDKGIRYTVNALYHISCPNIIPPHFISIKDIQPKDILFDINSLSFLRSKLLLLSSKNKFPKKIFISRKKASKRRLFNEDEVFNILSNYNFEKVFPEDYSIADQIAMFNNAEYIIGGSGAAFTNLLFCKNKCKSIIFMKSNNQYSGFSTIAKFSGVDLIYITEEVKKSDDFNNIHESFYINPSKFDTLIKFWI